MYQMLTFVFYYCVCDGMDWMKLLYDNILEGEDFGELQEIRQNFLVLPKSRSSYLV